MGLRFSLEVSLLKKELTWLDFASVVTEKRVTWSRKFAFQRAVSIASQNAINAAVRWAMVALRLKANLPLDTLSTYLGRCSHRYSRVEQL